MNDNKIQLQDFQNWSNKNNDFSLNDYIHIVFVSKKLHPDLFFAFINLMWPEFIYKNNYVLLKNSCQNEDQLSSRIQAGKSVEYWTNLINIDGFFAGTEQESNLNTLAISKRVAQDLASAWTLKLKSEYPNLKFVVKSIFDDEYDEVFVTFYQTKYEIND